MTATRETDPRWRRAFRCAPDSPRREPRREGLITRPLGLYADTREPQDDGSDPRADA